MVINEGPKDGYSLVLRIPELPGIMKERNSLDTVIWFFGTPLSCIALSVIILGSNTLSIVIVGLAIAALLSSVLTAWAGNRKIRKSLEGLSPEVTSAVISECNVVPQEKIRVGYGKSDFIVAQPDGEEMFWDLTPLDNEGRIGLRSRFQPA
jgi:energy-converting hydrogenase Eha subunit A